MPDDFGVVGAYRCDYTLFEAISEYDLTRFSNLECTYIDTIIPLINIVDEGRKGGAHRFIARERFRKKVDRDTWFTCTDDIYKDVENGDSWMLTDGEETHWEILHDGVDIDWNPQVASAESYLLKILPDPDISLVIYIEYPMGYIYVLKSEYVSQGRYYGPDSTAFHPFSEVVIYGEDHPEYSVVEGPSLPPKILEEAARLDEEYSKEIGR